MSSPVKINFITDRQTETRNNIDLIKQPRRSFIPQNNYNSASQPVKKVGKIKKIISGLTIFLIIVFAVFFSSVAFSNENLIKNFTNLNFLGQIGSLITSGDRALKGENDDRINFVLMGIGGGIHEGANLTDTMILGSFKPSTKQIAMVSVPRDLYVKTPKEGWAKINAVNAYAEKRASGSGGEETRAFLSDLLSTNIDYYAVIDFSGFEKLIDEFGGVDVYVDNNLVDYSYPVIGKEEAYPYESRYETLNIKKGWQHFDGAMALKYARSRHGLGVEGSDFARSKRQQKILLALKDKIMKYNFILNPGKISSLMDAYNQNVKTNLQIWEMVKLLRLGAEADYANPITYSLVDGKNPLLYDQVVNGAYVLLPYGGNFDKIQFVWQNLFTVGTSTIAIDRTKWEEFKNAATSTTASSTAKDTKTVSTTPPVITPAIVPANTDDINNTLPTADASDNSFTDEKAKIEIQNGTLITGWAGQVAATLRTKGFTITKTGNAAARNYTSIKIYDFSGGENQLTTSELQVLYGVRAIAPPAGLASSADILIILGK